MSTKVNWKDGRWHDGIKYQGEDRLGADRWLLFVSGGLDASGNQVRHYEKFSGTKKAALDKRRDLMREASTGLDLKASKITFADYLDRWVQHSRTRVKGNTLRRYEGLLDHHVRPLIGSVILSKLRPVHIQSVLDKMTEGGAAARSVVQCYRVMSSSLRQARRWQILSNNPAEGVQPPSPKGPDLYVPNREEVGRLLAAAGTYRLMIRADLASGLRRGELLALRWSDINFDERKIRVSAALDRVREEGLSRLALVDVKTARGKRVIDDISPAVLEDLKTHRKVQTERRLKAGEAWVDLDLVFDRGDGGPLDPDSFTHAFERIADAAGIGQMRLHDCRHVFASVQLRAGVPIFIVSRRLGHASSSFTMDTYGHLLDQGVTTDDVVGQALGL